MKELIEKAVSDYLEKKADTNGRFLTALEVFTAGVEWQEQYAALRNQELVDALQKAIGLLTNIRSETDYMPDFYYEWIDKVIDETEEYAISPWIPVAERLPEMSDFRPPSAIENPPVNRPVLVGTNKGRVFETVYTALGFANLRSSEKVTHWQPLPDAPKQ